jgi:hypothetical protein
MTCLPRAGDDEHSTSGHLAAEVALWTFLHVSRGFFHQQGPLIVKQTSAPQFVAFGANAIHSGGNHLFIEHVHLVLVVQIYCVDRESLGNGHGFPPSNLILPGNVDEGIESGAPPVTGMTVPNVAPRETVRMRAMDRFEYDDEEDSALSPSSPSPSILPLPPMVGYPHVRADGPTRTRDFGTSARSGADLDPHLTEEATSLIDDRQTCKPIG